MADVFVESGELTDTGAQARGNRIFGVKVGEATRVSFEVAPDSYDAAITFFLIGVIEGLRYRSDNAVLVLPNGHHLIAAHGEETLLVDDQGFPDWGAAMSRIAEISRLHS